MVSYKDIISLVGVGEDKEVVEIVDGMFSALSYGISKKYGINKLKYTILGHKAFQETYSSKRMLNIEYVVTGQRHLVILFNECVNEAAKRLQS